MIIVIITSHYYTPPCRNEPFIPEHISAPVVTCKVINKIASNLFI